MSVMPKWFSKSFDHWTEQYACSDPLCARVRRVWRRVSDRGTRGVQLQGARYCLPECFERALRDRLLQLLQTPMGKSRRPHRIPLGLLLFSRGDIDNTQLQTALTAQRTHGQGRLGEWIEHLGFASMPQITAALGAQWACPALFSIPARSISPLLPLPLLQRFRMAPVHYIEATRVMHVAFAEGVDYSALLAIEHALDCRAHPCIVSSGTLDSLISQLEETSRRTDQMFDSAEDAGEIVRIISSYAALLGAENIRLARCAEFIWVRLQATDAVNLLFAAGGTEKHPTPAAHSSADRLAHS